MRSRRSSTRPNLEIHSHGKATQAGRFSNAPSAEWKGADKKYARNGATPVLKTVAFMEEVMNGIIYIVGLIVIIMAILSFLGLR